jgi:hypothetical protein
MQLSLRTLVSRAFDAADWVIIRTLSGVQVASKKFWVSVAGFVIWLFGYLSTGHAAAFDWDVVAPSWISRFVPNLEAEFGLALMFASMVPIYWPRGTEASGGMLPLPLALILASGCQLVASRPF